jgi:hypothetical protein
MIHLSAPNQARIPIGTVVINGQKAEVTINLEWARFFESLTASSNSNTAAVVNGKNGIDGVAVMLGSDGTDSVEYVPGPPGAPGRQGDPGPALFLLQDDIGEQAMLVPPSVDGTYVPISSKDSSGGIPGLTLLKLNLKNVAGTITSWFTTAATAARTWTMPDKDGTVAVLSDFASPPAIGSTAPAAASFTTVSASGQSLGTGVYNVAPGIAATTTAINLASTFASTNSDASQFLCGYSGSSADPTPAIYWKVGGALRLATANNAQAGGFTLLAQLDTAGWKVANGFGCNGKAAQAAVASGGTLAGVIAALVANGILSS